MIKCEDCGLPYDDFGLDTTIENLEWEAIDGHGILCANCMVKRASKKIDGVIAARMHFVIIPKVIDK